MVSTAPLLWRLLTSHGKLYSMAFVKKQLFATSVRSPRIRALTFHLMSAWFTMYVPDSYRTSVLFASLSTYFSLVSSFCSSDQMFAADFFQIPPRDGHPCLSGYTIPTIRGGGTCTRLTLLMRSIPNKSYFTRLRGGILCSLKFYRTAISFIIAYVTTTSTESYLIKKNVK